MNAMTNIVQVGIFNFRIAPCHLCKTEYYYHMMLDVSQVTPVGRVCVSCWKSVKAKERAKQVVQYAERKQKQMELVA